MVLYLNAHERLQIVLAFVLCDFSISTSMQAKLNTYKLQNGQTLPSYIDKDDDDKD